MKKLLILLFSILISFNSYGEISYKKYLENPSRYGDYIDTLEIGMSWYGVVIDNPNVELFCKPGDLVLSSNTIHLIIERQVERFISSWELDKKFVYNLPIASILIYGLQFTYPCN